MRISKFEVTPVVVPMPPHRAASGVVTASPLVLLTVHTDVGVSGQSMIFTYTPAALKPCADLMCNMEPLVAGQELAPATLSDALHSRFKLLGTQGLVGMVLAGIDMALWDALARSTGLSLHKLLGGVARPLPIYVGIAFDGEVKTARTAEAWAKRGLRAVKARLGYPTLKEDLAVIRAVRSAVGPDIAVMVDYNQSLEPTEAETRLRALDGEGLEWIEEPVLAHDFAAFVRLCETTETPLQAGESWWGPMEFRHAINRGVRELLMIDVMKAGGITGWTRIAAAAHSYSIPVSNHLWPEVSAQLLMTLAAPKWLEYADWWNPILLTPLRVENGLAYVGEGSGIGVEFDPAAVEKYRI